MGPLSALTSHTLECGKDAKIRILEKEVSIIAGLEAKLKVAEARAGVAERLVRKQREADEREEDWKVMEVKEEGRVGMVVGGEVVGGEKEERGEGEGVKIEGEEDWVLSLD